MWLIYIKYWTFSRYSNLSSLLWTVRKMFMLHSKLIYHYILSQNPQKVTFAILCLNKTNFQKPRTLLLFFKTHIPEVASSLLPSDEHFLFSLLSSLFFLGFIQSRKNWMKNCIKINILLHYQSDYGYLKYEILRDAQDKRECIWICGARVLTRVYFVVFAFWEKYVSVFRNIFLIWKQRPSGTI